MIPVLYSTDEVFFTSNGIGRLIDCVSCEVTEERNGIFECEFKYPITGQHYEDIQLNRIIYCTHDDTRTPQPFDIYKRSAPIDGIVTFNARHISYRLNNIILDPFTAETCALAMSGLATNSVNYNPFHFYTDKAVTATFGISKPASVRSVLGGTEGSILDVYGKGEYKFDKFSVWFYTNRGSNKGVSIRYGKNLVSLTHELDDADTYNTVVPYWASDDGSTVVTLPEHFVISSEGVVVNSVWWDEDYEYFVDENGNRLEFAYTPPKAVVMDLSADFETEPTEDELRTLATTRLANSEAWVPKENLQIDFLQWWQTGEYEDVAPLQTVNLCDIVSVYYTALGVETTAKVIKTVYDTLQDRYSAMELGDAQTSFADVILSDSVNAVTLSPAFSSVMTEAIAKATNLLVNGNVGSHVIIHTNDEGAPDEIYVLDNEDADLAENVLRINLNGIGFSQTGLDGPYTSAWTLDGSFVANFITAGTMSADRIRTGKIVSVGGESYWDLDNGEFNNESSDASIYMTGGSLMCYSPESEDYTGKLGTFYYGDDTTKYGIGLFTKGTQMMFGAIDSNDDYKASIILNNGANAGGYEEDVWIKGSIRMSHLIKINGIVYCYWLSPLEGHEEILISGNVLMNYLAVGNGIGSGDIYVGTLHYYHMTEMSDRRSKDLLEWDDRYDGLLDLLKPTLFNYKGQTQRRTGFIAQDVQEALEELGIEDSALVSEFNDKLGLNYIDLIALLVKRSQEQKTEIQNLKERLSDLESKVEMLCKSMNCQL